MNIDWDNLRRQAQALRQSLDGESRSQAQAQAQLAERARALAVTPPSAVAEDEQALQVLEVVLAGMRYAFEVEFLVEVLPWTPLTAVPGAPSFVLGMLLARGRVVSCIDLLSFLGLPVAQLLEPAGIVVLAHGDMEIGLPVQQVSGIERVLVTPANGSGQLPGRAQHMLRGLTPGGAFVLDGARLLSDSRLPVYA